MADTKISAMPAAATLDGTEIVPLVQANTNVQIDVSDLIIETLTVAPLPIAQGGTGQDNATDALLALLPAQGSNRFLHSDGTNVTFQAVDLDSTDVNGILQVDKGGTGAVTLTGYVKGTGISALTASATIPLTDTTGTLSATRGGTGFTTYTTGDIIYASATNTLSKLAGNTTTTNKFLRQLGTGSVSTAPDWDIIDPSDINTQYGAFNQSTTLTNVTVGTGMPMRFDTTDLSNGVTIESDGTNPTYITPSIGGTYNFQFSAQLNKNGGGSSAIDVYIWMRLNGTDIPATNTRVTIQGPSSYTVAAWNFFFESDAGDHFQLMWASADVHAEITALTPAIGPTIPAVILTVNQVS
jgi:hypothetical protein